MGNASGRTPKADDNSLGWLRQFVWSVYWVSDIVITLRNDDAHVMQYFTLPHMSLWTPCRLCGVRVESVQTPRTLIHLSKVHTDSVQTLHGLCMDFARTYILQ
jgi:hypothetical protein